ncbi:nicotinate-nucleotide adenylyltransferase [uncultured Helcococcus sp.]|uniref:nicotinate-nucleotide adenylyltransferase n=1 Tax=uncultured Helcococcus sp. TaxID=1072508 RepID=UPI00288953EC|nr:nicotinate-nucleotide adenylyltransferase [uncultured Helcococcus sp.]
MKVGLFGSSFNPIHIGHLVIAEQARVRLGLDKVLFIPTANPYHKKVDLLDYDIRYKIVEETIKDNKYFEISEVEKNLKKNSYSYDVVKKLKKKNKDDYYFIMGSDSFQEIETWYEYNKFIDLLDLVVFKRPGYDVEGDHLNKMRNFSKNRIFYFDDLQLEISSTYIRNSIRDGYIPKYLLREETIAYIKDKKLWQE